MIPKEVIVGLIANLPVLVAGICMGWTSSMFPLLSADGVGNPLESIPSTETLSWIGSSLAIGAIIAPFAGGYLADRMGRKKTLLGTSPLFIISFLLLALHPTLEWIFVARFLQGLGVGISITVQAMYIGEIASDNLRGALGSLMAVFMCLGILIMNCIGPYLSFETVQGVLLSFPILTILLSMALPESPFHSVAKNRSEEAMKTLSFLRNKPEKELLEEMQKIESLVSDTKADGEGFSEMFKAANLRALIICTVLIASQQLSGVNGISFYASTIFQGSGTRMDDNVAVIILSAVQFIASGLTPIVADKWGRKTLLLWSSAGSAVFLFAFALYWYGTENQIQAISSLDWLPLTSLIGYFIAFSFGLGPIPWALSSELVTPKIKAYAMPIITCTSWTSTFVVTKYFHPISLAIGSHWLFAIFGLCSTVAFVFTILCVFETKGLSLQEVQAKLGKQNKG